MAHPACSLLPEEEAGCQAFQVAEAGAAAAHPACSLLPEAAAGCQAFQVVEVGAAVAHPACSPLLAEEAGCQASRVAEAGAAVAHPACSSPPRRARSRHHPSLPRDPHSSPPRRRRPRRRMKLSSESPGSPYLRLLFRRLLFGHDNRDWAIDLVERTRTGDQGVLGAAARVLAIRTARRRAGPTLVRVVSVALLVLFCRVCTQKEEMGGERDAHRTTTSQANWLQAEL